MQTRAAQPLGELPAKVLLAQLAIKQKDEARALESLKVLGERIKTDSLQATNDRVATVLLSVLNSFLNLQGVSPFYQWIVKGLILIGALCLDFIRKRR